jgi:NAD(P)-dependent dehydrogenase (short-subunit alcohol dehydrogenase family)
MVNQPVASQLAQCLRDAAEVALKPPKFHRGGLLQVCKCRLLGEGRPAAEIRGDARRKNIPPRRFGRPEEFGAIRAVLSSTHAACMTGQNVLADGGAYSKVY